MQQKVALTHREKTQSKKPMLTERTERAWFSYLLQYLAREWSGFILSTPEPASLLQRLFQRKPLQIPVPFNWSISPEITPSRARSQRIVRPKLLQVGFISCHSTMSKHWRNDNRLQMITASLGAGSRRQTEQARSVGWMSQAASAETMLTSPDQSPARSYVDKQQVRRSSRSAPSQMETGWSVDLEFLHWTSWTTQTEPIWQVLLLLVATC